MQNKIDSNDIYGLLNSYSDYEIKEITTIDTTYELIAVIN